MIYLGLDPGKNGAIAAVDEYSEVVAIIRLNQDYSDIVEQFLNLYYSHDIEAVLLERVHSMPGQGVSSTFKFGTNYGFLLGILECCKLPYELISPATWQKRMNCRTKGNKNITKKKAQKLFKGQKVIHATADALLLAELCRQNNT